MKQSQFLKVSHIDSKLVKSVIRQFGGFESFKECYQDVVNHGINGGFSGFIYYDDTVKFALKNRDMIIELAKQDAESIGESGVLEFIQSFNCLGKKDYSVEEVGQSLFSSKAKAKENTQVLNALAWYAAEEVCRSFDNVSMEG